MFINLNLNNNLIELIEEDIKGEVEDNKEDVVYDLREGYINVEIINKTNNKVEYSR